MNTQIIAIANQKGGVGKTTTCANLGIGLAQAGKKVLLIDGDPQGSLTISLVNAMSRETILRQYLDTLKGQYSHILIDCQPSLGMLTVNALAAANRIIIPVQAEYLMITGLMWRLN